VTDYIWGTGSSGSMMIRDTGGNVEFWINSNNSSTWSDHIPWSGTVNGTGVSGSYSYPAGAGWRRLGVWYVGTNQNVTFNLGNTGTSGFGGPSSHTVFIQRATVPPAPNAVVLSNISSTGMDAVFSGNGDGGSGIYIWQIGYGTEPDGPTAYINTFSTHISGLTPGATYYFWARGQNAQGFGPWSVRSSATTLRVPDAPSAPVVSYIDQVSAIATITVNGDGGATITAYQLGWGLSSTTPTSTHTGPLSQIISGLLPGKVYYFFGRVQNSVGFSPWSTATAAKTIAGARVKVSGVWKDAIPYVRVGGVWKVARPWGRVAGVWKETT